MSAGGTVRAVAAHQRSYEDPIAVLAGEVVEVGRADADDPRWRWCVHRGSRRTGWVPEAFIALDASGKCGVARRDYSAAELSVAAGERVTGGESVAGWTWCAKADGSEGWLPSRKLAAAASPASAASEA